jgi:hypothetical protein
MNKGQIMNKKITIALTLAAIFSAGCNNFVPNRLIETEKTSGSKNNVQTPSQILTKELENEYSAFTTKALTEAYLLKKIMKWLNEQNGLKMAKEIDFARQRHPELLLNIMTADHSLYLAANALPEVTAKRSEAGDFNTYMETLAGRQGEFRVNTTTLSDQDFSDVAVNSDGSFTVVWQSYGQDGSQGSVFGQRFNSNGSKIGAEFQVNTTIANYQGEPAITANNDGSFTVVWRSDDQDGSGLGVFGQRFNANATKNGSEFQVNTYIAGNQFNGRIAGNGDGSFIVVWQSIGQDGSGFGVYGQRFNADSTKNGAEFPVNTFTTNDQSQAKIAVNSDNTFTVVWTSYSQDGSAEGIYGQRFNADATKNGSEFLINTLTSSNQTSPDIAGNNDKSFTVVWDSYLKDGSFAGICGQRFNSSAVKVGGDFVINSYTADQQTQPVITGNTDGSFTVAWQSNGQDGNGLGIFGQRFNASAAKIGQEFSVNTYITGHQQIPAISGKGDGSFIILWLSPGQDSSGNGVYGQRFDNNGNTL